MNTGAGAESIYPGSFANSGLRLVEPKPLREIFMIVGDGPKDPTEESHGICVFTLNQGIIFLMPQVSLFQPICRVYTEAKPHHHAFQSR